MSDIEETYEQSHDLEPSVKPKKCTSCGMAAKGHNSPLGKRCPNQQTVEDLKGDQTETRDDLMAEMVKQLASMNTGIAALLEQQTMILKLSTQHNSGTQATQAAPVVHEASSISENNQPGHHLTSGVKLTDTVYKQAISGEFVNLSDFLPQPEITAEYETHVINGSIQVRPKKPKKSIESFSAWLQAWNNFESLIMSSHPTCYSNLLAYRQFIQAANRKYTWAAVYSYDLQFRAALAREKSFNYGEPKYDLVVSTLDATAIRTDVSRCFRCRAVDHAVQECPFPAVNPMAASTQEKKVKTGPGQFKWFHQSKEGCNNFNYGRCRVTECKRAHVCKACRGNEPYITCSQCHQN